MPPTVTQDFFDSADVSRLDEEAEPIFSFLKQASHEQRPTPVWRELKGSVPDGIQSAQPWEQGYRLAIQLRQHLNLQERLFTGTDSDLMGALNLNLPIYPWSTSQLDAVAAFSAEGTPVFAIRGGRAECRKVALCRALGETLIQQGETPLLCTKTFFSERQKRSRAFAAEFLAPHALLREELGQRRGAVTQSDCEHLGEMFGVSSMVIQHQVDNHRLSE